jgi:hypothetical protein
MWGVLSEERTGLLFTIAAGPRQRSHLRVRVPWAGKLSCYNIAANGIKVTSLISRVIAFLAVTVL